MKAIVVYESMFSNTEQIARAIAVGLGESVDLQVAEVTDAPTEPDPEVALIVAGGPTHAFSTSRKNTRADAVNQGAHEGEAEFGLREWMAALPSGRHTERWPLSTPRSKACTIYLARLQRAPRRPPDDMGMSPWRKRRVSTSVISMVRSSTVRSIGPGPGVGNSLCLSREQPMQRPSGDSCRR